MAYLPGEPSHKSGNSSSDKETTDKSVGKWFFSRKEIEENSPSRADGIDLRKEIYLRKSYCTFLQDFGMRLKIPQVTIATAIVFCHRFFLRQSHAKNDRRIIATVCLFLAGKVEETPRLLKDVIIVSYEIIHKKDPSAVQKIKQKDVYEQQKELILLGERIVLATLGFDLNVYHPYKPLVEAIKRFKVAQNALAQVAWNFVNDGLRTSLCLQYKPHLIAAGAIFLAAKFLKVKLPSDGEVIWWQEFDVTPRQLEDVSNQMLELYEQNRAGQSSLTNEVEGSIGGNNQPAIMAPAVSQSSISGNGPSSDVGTSRIKQEPVPASCPSGSLPQHAQKNSDGNGSSDNKRGFWDCNVDGGNVHSIQEVEKNSSHHHGNATETSKSAILNKLGNPMEAKEWQDHGRVISSGPGNHVSSSDGAVKEFSPPDAIKKFDKNKFKAASEKRQRLHNDVAKKNDIADDDDLIEKEPENGIELSIDEKISKQVRHRDCSSPLSKQEPGNDSFDQEGSRDAKNIRLSGQRPLVRSAKSRASNVEHSQEEEGELSSLDEQEFPSPRYRSKAVISKQLTGLCVNGRPDGFKRNQDDYECAKRVNERVMGSRRHSKGWQQIDDYEYAKPDGLKRNRDDYECARPVNERVLGSRRHSEGWEQHADSHRLHEASLTAGLGNPERDHKKQRYATHG